MMHRRCCCFCHCVCLRPLRRWLGPPRPALAQSLSDSIKSCAGPSRAGAAPATRANASQSIVASFAQLDSLSTHARGRQSAARPESFILVVVVVVATAGLVSAEAAPVRRLRNLGGLILRVPAKKQAARRGRNTVELR